MQNFLYRAKVFISANKTFVAVVVFGVILVALVGGNYLFSSVSNFAYERGIDLPGMPAVLNYGGSSDSVVYSAGYAEKSYAAPSYAPIPNRGAPASTQTVPSDKKIVRNGRLDLLVKNADDTSAQISSIVSDNGGFVQNSSLREYTEGVKSGNIVVRVPNSNFDKAIAAIKAIAVKVEEESVTSDDVTAQYVDLQAQVKNYQAEEKQYQEIMARAVKIEDVLSVASRLADVRGRIERTQGQLNYLARQVDMSTIVVSLTAEPEVKVFGIVWRPLTVLKQAFKGMLSDLTGLADWLIAFLFKVPIYLLRLAVAVIIIWIVWKLLLVIKRKMFAPRL